MNPTVSTKRGGCQRSQAAFTFIDLLVVAICLAMIAMLAATALAHSQPSSDRAVCASNLRRLMQAWQMYADDNSGRLVACTTEATRSWVSGYLDYTLGNNDNTNTLKLTNLIYAAIGPYVNSASIFRCPSDNSTIQFPSGPKLRVRSYSMNSYVGPNLGPWNTSYQVMTRLTEIPQPDRVFVLLEEHPDSINDVTFVTDPGATGSSGRLIDYPACFHSGGINLGMADGRVAYWQWADNRTMIPITGTAIGLNVPSANNPDVDRLAAVTSYRR